MRGQNGRKVILQCGGNWEDHSARISTVTAIFEGGGVSWDDIKRQGKTQIHMKEGKAFGPLCHSS